MDNQTAVAERALRSRMFCVSILALTIPIIDFPYLGGNAFVRPIAIALAGVVFLFRFLSVPQYLSIPSDWYTKFVITFCIYAILSGIVARVIWDLPYEVKGITYPERAIRDFSSLGAAALFFMFLRVEFNSLSIILKYVRWINISGIIVLLIAFIQIGKMEVGGALFAQLDNVISFIRYRQTDTYSKIFGTAPEASMFADQILSLFLPFLIAAIITGHSYFKIRILGAKLETYLLPGYLAALFFTRSRIGLITIVFMFAIVILFGGALGIFRRKTTNVSVGISSILLIILLVGISESSDLRRIAGSIGNMEMSIDQGIWSNVTRAACILSGFKAGVTYPFGVGIGGFPFIFEEMVPEWGLSSPEIQAMLAIDYTFLESMTGEFGLGDIEDRLADAKSIVARVVAETGLPGVLVLVTAWLKAIRGLRPILLAMHDGARGTPHLNGEVRTIAISCMLSMIAMIPLSFNINSYLWVHWFFILALAISLPRALKSRSSTRKI